MLRMLSRNNQLNLNDLAEQLNVTNCLIWAFSQNFYYFLVAAIINSFNRVTMNSWGCLLVEDCDRSQIINIYAWVNISGLVAVFFAPITGLCFP